MRFFRKTVPQESLDFCKNEGAQPTPQLHPLVKRTSSLYQLEIVCQILEALFANLFLYGFEQELQALLPTKKLETISAPKVRKTL